MESNMRYYQRRAAEERTAARRNRRRGKIQAEDGRDEQRKSFHVI